MTREDTWSLLNFERDNTATRQDTAAPTVLTPLGLTCLCACCVLLLLWARSEIIAVYCHHMHDSDCVGLFVMVGRYCPALSLAPSIYSTGPPSDSISHTFVPVGARGIDTISHTFGLRSSRATSISHSLWLHLRALDESARSSPVSPYVYYYCYFNRLTAAQFSKNGKLPMCERQQYLHQGVSPFV